MHEAAHPGVLEPDLRQQLPGEVGRGRVGADPGDAGDRVLRGDAGGDGRAVRAVLRPMDDELDAEALRVGRHEGPIRPVHGAPGVAEALGPEGERGLGGNAEEGAGDHPGAGATLLRPADLEEREDAPGAAGLVAEVQVVHVRRVEVDRRLDQPKAQHPGVEVDGALCVRADRGHVVDPVKAHLGGPLLR